MKDYIEKLRSIIGVDLLGVVEAKPMTRIEANLIEHRNLNYFTEFENKNIKSRTDPGAHLKNPKSIFVIGMSYYWDDPEEGIYKLSNHARGRDYHQILGEKLEALKRELEKDYEFFSYAQVDSGDLYEKELGRLAGFGYIAKNGLLINERYGSYIFLGLLVTDIEVESYSKEVSGSCGDCKLCQEACPSGSIKGDYKIDSSICHSYLTQWKGEIPESKRIDYVYGCDICQLVCPKNHKIEKNLHEDFKPKLRNLDGVNIEKMSNRQFKKEFRDYSFSWIGKKRIIRNKENIDRRG